MPRGGARPGAGRKPTTPPADKFDLAGRLRLEPGGSRGLRQRVVMALAAYGAEPAEIAAALDVQEEHVAEFFADEFDTGRDIGNLNVVAQLYRRATADGAAWALGAAKWWLRRAGWDDRSRRRQSTAGTQQARQQGL